MLLPTSKINMGGEYANKKSKVVISKGPEAKKLM